MPLDSDNLRKLVDRYWSVLVEWVGGDRDGVEDVVQAAFIKLAAEEPPPTNCVGWLFTVTKRLAINEHTAKAQRRSREAKFGLQKAKASKNDDDLELHDWLSILEPREREVVIARIWGDLTFEQIGSVYGESKTSVWRTYQSGLAKLRESHSEHSHEQQKQ